MAVTRTTIDVNFGGTRDAFEEGKHKRNHGQFASGSSGGSSEKKPAASPADKHKAAMQAHRAAAKAHEQEHPNAQHLSDVAHKLTSKIAKSGSHTHALSGIANEHSDEGDSESAAEMHRDVARSHEHNFKKHQGAKVGSNRAGPVVKK